MLTHIRVRSRGIEGTRHVIFMNAGDMAARGLSDGEMVDLESRFDDGQSRRAEAFRVVPYDIPAGRAAAYFPETNVLVSVDSYADRSHTPTSKFIPVRVDKR